MQGKLILTSLISLLGLSPVLIGAPLSQEPSRNIYQTYVRAFYDGSETPDGEGDFQGLIEKIDYFQELGVDTLLLMPVFKSTGGMGYIPRDYFLLDEAYGSIEQFEVFINTMHTHGIKIVLDAPVNHISFDSEWFKEGVKRSCDPNDEAHNPNDPNNQYCDYFYFIPNPCQQLPYSNWHKPWHWQTTDCTAVWFEHPQIDRRYHREDYVYATFFHVMPDLKFWNFATNSFHEPVVNRIQEFFNIWASRGVDGFRIDAAKHFIEGNDNKNPLQPENLALLKRWLEGVRQVNPDVSFIGEIWAGHDQFEPYLEGSLDMVLDFPFMESVRNSVNYNYGGSFKRVLKHFENTQDHIKPGQRVVFAGNHDVSRMLTQWDGNEDKLRMAHFLSLTSPHTPLLYYGEELGMLGKVKRPDNTSDEEYVRTINAFSWRGDSDSVGFPGGIVPVTKPAENYKTHNLEVAQANPDSAWNLVKELLRIRKAFRISENTKLRVLDDLYGHVIGYSFGTNDRCRVILANFSADTTYTIAKPTINDCGSGSGSTHHMFLENAEVQDNNFEMRPYGKVIYDIHGS